MGNLVDFLTTDPGLAKSMIERYVNSLEHSGVKYEVDGSGNSPLYSFDNLPRDEVLAILDKEENSLRNSAEYEVRSTDTGNYIKIRNKGKILTDREEIEELVLKGKLFRK